MSLPKAGNVILSHFFSEGKAYPLTLFTGHHDSLCTLRTGHLESNRPIWPNRPRMVRLGQLMHLA